MFSKRKAFQFCCEPFERIEGFYEALVSAEQYEVHHRFEGMALSFRDLISLKMYYKRPACELIFLKRSEHRTLHGRTRFADASAREAQSRAVRRTWADPKLREKQAARNKVTWSDPILRARASERMHRRWLATPPECQAQEIERLRKLHEDPHNLLKMHQACERRWAKDGSRSEQADWTRQSWRDPAVRQRRSEGIRRALADPEVLAARSAKIKAVRAAKTEAYRIYREGGGTLSFREYHRLKKQAGASGV